MTLCVSGLMFAQGAAAQAGGSQHSPEGAMCGQSRSVLLRFLDGRAAMGVKVVLTAASPAMGGPELYVAGRETNQFGPSAGQGGGVAPMSTPEVDCTPIVTGTLKATTDQRGLVRFDQLGEGTWILQFEGEVTHQQDTASVVPASLQGLYPQGRTREGGGFVEQVTALNEEGGPSQQPVQPGAGPTTSRYVLEFSSGQGGWLPGIDLAAANDAPPIPLASITVGAVGTPSVVRQASSDGSGTGDSTQESTFDASGAYVVPGSDQQPSQRTVQTSTHLISAWWVAVAGLVIGGLVAIAWATRRTSQQNAPARVDKESRRRNWIRQ
ncbi:MAG: hypothetical protein IVW55_00550 [Chloroflexi bacterium]|nr:hypothetical protein [Chloroflexota bacterium]